MACAEQYRARMREHGRRVAEERQAEMSVLKTTLKHARSRFAAQHGYSPARSEDLAGDFPELSGLMIYYQRRKADLN